MSSPVLQGLASGAEHPLIDLDATAFLQFGIFVVLMFLASRMLFRPYLKMRDERQAGIEGSKQEAAKMAGEADASLADYENKLVDARSRAALERRKIRNEAAEHQSKVTGEARAQAAVAMAEASQKVAQEVEGARSQLMPQAETLASEIVETLLGRKVS